MPKPRFSAGWFVIAMSSKLIAPESGCSRPAIILNVVVLPQPEGPSKPKNSPRSTSSDTSVTAGVLSKRLERFLRERSGISTDFSTDYTDLSNDAVWNFIRLVTKSEPGAVATGQGLNSKMGRKH